MKKVILSAVALACAAGVASADVYGDAPFDIFDAGFTHLDIQSVTITNDASWLYISVANAGDLDATSWGKYAIGIDNGKATGMNSNGWGRNIDWGRGITHWSATWADDGGTGVGGEIYSGNATAANNSSGGMGAWILRDATYAAGTEIAGSDANHAFGVQTWQISLARLNLQAGDTMEFDVVTTGGGGGDPGVDHLSVAGLATPGWGDASIAGAFKSYTVVPSPASAALLGLGGLVGLRRRR
ncbi:MAG: hypothetical protein ACI89L_000059 [Phycisphaerales bacterium]|jgi:hypothetical protein